MPGSAANDAFAADLWRTLVECVRDTDRHGRVRFRENHHGTAPVAHTWPVSQLLHAAALRDEAATVAEVVAQLEPYAHRGYGFGEALADHPGRDDVYVDDNAWVGLALAQAAPGPLDHAGRARLAACTAFCCATQRDDGGVPWRIDVETWSHNACSTAPTGVLALRAAGRGAAPAGVDPVAVATGAERFCTTRLGRDDGLVADHLRADGTVDWAVWSYNQGAVVLLRTLLSVALDDHRLLASAVELADAALDEFRGERLWTQPPAFNAVLFRGLLVLDAHEPRPRVRAALAEHLDRVRAEAYDVSTGLCIAGGIGTYEDATVLDQAALVQLFTLAGLPPERCKGLC
jgi:hypothetical protein